MTERGFIDWSVWFQRATELGGLYQRRREALLVMASIIAHADNMGTGWNFSTRDDFSAFGSEVGLTADEFEDGLKVLLSDGLIAVNGGEMRVNFNETFK